MGEFVFGVVGDTVSLRPRSRAGVDVGFGIGVKKRCRSSASRTSLQRLRRAARAVRRHRPSRWVDAVEQAAEHLAAVRGTARIAAVMGRRWGSASGKCNTSAEHSTASEVIRRFERVVRRRQGGRARC